MSKYSCVTNKFSYQTVVYSLLSAVEADEYELVDGAISLTKRLI